MERATAAYYGRGDPLGSAGDFTTAPEVSQAFGEVLGAWLAQAWSDLGRPASVRLVELGPGRGTLMADVLRSAAAMPGLRDAASLHLVETSGRLRALQAERLAGWQAAWHDDLAAVPPGPLLLLANEFFDALPVHQLARTERGWCERMITLGADGRLEFTVADGPSPRADDVPAAAAAPIGTIAEVSPARAALARTMARRIAGAGGVALIIDYGAWANRPTGDTLQAMRGHTGADPLMAPGEVDVTCQVDFRRLAEAAAAGGAAVFGPVPQGTFLRTLGIHLRTARLLERATPAQRRTLRAGLFRLIDPAAMGELFKVLVLAAPDRPLPPGFGAATLAPGGPRP